MPSVEIEKLKKEQEELKKKLNQIEQAKSQLMIRLVEIQGILKYLQPEEKVKSNNNKEEVK